MTTALQLGLTLPPPGSRHVRRALHDQLRAAILDGRLAPGLPLPPSRTLARDLGLSRTTVVTVYDLLLSEGYVVARTGAGTFVADTGAKAQAGAAAGGPPPGPPSGVRLNPALLAPGGARAPTLPPEVAVNFRLGLPDTSDFPFDIWGRLYIRALRAFARAQPGYREPAGRPALRAAVAGHVSFTRAVACRAEDIVITAGAQQAFDLLARVLVTPDRPVVAMEDPGYASARGAFLAAGAQLHPVPVDGEGLVVDALPPDAAVVYVTPSHQFPLGVPLSPRRRQALLAYAAARGAVIVEDDYDGEFRYGGRPLDALQTLDGGARVFYVGTFSKSLFPALRLGFIAAPSWARDSVLRAKQVADWHAPVVEQDTLAAFMAEGHLARHVRRMRTVYDERRTALLGALAAHCGDLLDPVPAVAGLHLAVRFRRPVDADAVVAQALAVGIGVESLATYALRPAPEGPAPGDVAAGLAFGYGGVGVDAIAPAVSRLAAILRGATRSAG
ncbi:PLP-dependent aminotransferase family protein [Nitrospirillum sp. BR 11164]|uniref:MocR-like pyridoxine biosynthesis transcription factor PdxR n=1 Tax=Nitrospirillum sp. BR 11164 TaxID=3104324 RepID=UPI002AFE9870|nr:PLP-dependent aminotransferase family protein [Nitrospirillum sp. BR 11164]MEA1647659.1 PLP-dependent aminotransferase family protein [Nitrospirillum sp. BR 11164]